MKLDKITIENFRCFRHYEMELAPQMSILIGKNGSGKTTLINSILRGLTFIFSKDTSVSKKPLSDGVKGLNIIKYDEMDAHFRYEETGYQYPINIKCSASFENTPIEWELLKKTAGGSLYSTKYKAGLTSFNHIYQKKNQLPLLAYFSDSYPHVDTKISKYATSILKSGRPMVAPFAYYQWDKETTCTEMWQRRFKNCRQNWNTLNSAIANLRIQSQLIEEQIDSEQTKKTGDEEKIKQWQQAIQDNRQLIQEKEILSGQYEREFNYVRNLLIRFTAGVPEFADYGSFKIKDVDIEHRDEAVYIQFCFADESKCLFRHLPTGYKRLLSIVFDIAYRSFIISSENEPTGIILIDEIDLHLHPELEQIVVELFKHTFPAIQFIVTTHSPLVIANFQQDENNKIIRMTCQENEYANEVLPNLYGVDYNTSWIVLN